MEKAKNFSQRRVFFRTLVGLGFLGLLVFGISSCNLPEIGEILPVSNPTDLPSVDLATPTPQPTPTQGAPITQASQLILWLPPQFDPNNGTTAGDLLLSRLDGFVSRRPQTDLQVRVKTLTGDFGLLDSLQMTETAAPLLMPDLVALPRPLLENAYRAGLVIPLDEYTDTLAENDWYKYAHDMAVVDGQTAGIPFAGDLMVLAYKDDQGSAPPTDWNSLLGTQRALAFPASDPGGLVTMAWYQSLGGELSGEDGVPMVDEDRMFEVLNYYRQAQNANVMPYWLTQFETDDQAWGSYLERQSTLAISWSSRVLGSDSPNTILAAMPTKDAKVYTYADGWVWCIIPSNQETEEIALELAEYLSESEFLSTWALEAGYLPVRPAELESWSDMPYYPTLEKLLPAAVLVPDEDLKLQLGPVIRDAVVSVLKDQVEVEAAMEALIAELGE